MKFVSLCVRLRLSIECLLLVEFLSFIQILNYNFCTQNQIDKHTYINHLWMFHGVFVVANEVVLIHGEILRNIQMTKLQIKEK